MEISVHQTYLQRTLDLAVPGEGNVYQGPLVGWVLANNALIIEEGNSTPSFLASDQGSIAQWKDSTLFLSINPFADTQTLTSFCAQRSIEACYVATDPDSPVRQAALDLNRRYLTWQRRERPYLMLKWAETADGFMARADYQPYWISNPHARKLVHQWRSQEAAIWVGKNTYHHDNPHLNVRDWEGNDPIRIVVDPQLQLSDQLHVFDQSQSTLCYNLLKAETCHNLEFVRLPDTEDWKDRIKNVLDDLHRRHIQSVLVEGGAVLLSFLLENRWWDEARVFRAPVTFGEGIAAPIIPNDYCYEQQRVSDNTLTVYRRPNS